MQSNAFGRDFTCPYNGIYQAVSAFLDSLRPSFHQSDPEGGVSFGMKQFVSARAAAHHG
jgi:hypothetical protein